MKVSPPTPNRFEQETMSNFTVDKIGTYELQVFAEVDPGNRSRPGLLLPLFLVSKTVCRVLIRRQSVLFHVLRFVRDCINVQL